MGAILIVDDEKNIRETLATYIQSLGHTVETAADAETALDAVDRRDFDLVVSDVRMKGLGGLGLLRQIRERHRDAAVVLMTAYATVPQAVEAMRLGAYEYLIKPFSPDDVRLLINHVLDARTSHRDRATVRRGVDHPSEPSNATWGRRRLRLNPRRRRSCRSRILNAAVSSRSWRGHRRLMPPPPGSVSIQ
jgi:DNA-binding NtrC family response regulator